MTAAAGRLALWLASALGAGYLRPAPGTWGSLVGLAFFVPLLAPAGVTVQLAAWGVVTVAGTWAADVTARSMAAEDPSLVVIDEVSGMWISIIGVTSPAAFVLAFFVFRILDIVKPFPARRMEDLPGGVGIMADDVVAGLYTLLVVWLAMPWLAAGS